MSDILDRILATKREEVASARAEVPEATLALQAKAAVPARDFVGAIRSRIAMGRPAVIAEFKRASPSAGDIASAADPAAVARSYEANGAACLSVLTDRQYFKGSAEDLKVARAACTLPVIRKDFIIDRYQVFEARAMGADAILLIVGTAPISQLQALERVATDLGMAVLAEVHNEAELAEALQLRTPLIGVNNRNLKTFDVSLDNTLRLKPLIPAGRIVVSESGIKTRSDVEQLRTASVSAYLIGTSLVSNADPGSQLRSLFG